MTKRRPKTEEVETELAKNEEFISKDTVEIIVAAVEEEENNHESTVWVRFSNFEDMEEAEEYAIFLQETLPLLLFNTTKIN
jgi:hypothetical protein